MRSIRIRSQPRTNRPSNRWPIKPADRPASTSRTWRPLLVQAVADLDRHYVITYQPAGHADGKFHPVEVRVKRPGAQMRTRTGYWAPMPRARRGCRDRGDARHCPVPPVPFEPVHPSMGRNVARRQRAHERDGDVGSGSRPAAQSATDVGRREGDGDRRPGAVSETRSTRGRNRVTFDAAPGYVALEMTIHSSSGADRSTPTIARSSCRICGCRGRPSPRRRSSGHANGTRLSRN